MKSLYIFFLFLILAIGQIYVPARMIHNHEKVLKTGKAFKFKTKPVDPTNPFKGKYINLRFELEQFYTSDSIWSRNDDIYVLLENDSLGYAKAVGVSVSKPSKGDYVRAKVYWYNSREKTVQFSLPFNEFYMEESKAYDAELAYINLQREASTKSIYALVHVRDGEAVLANVFVDKIPIADYVEKFE